MQRAAGQQKVLFALFRGADSGGAFQLVTGGVNNVKFWSVKGKALKPTLGLFGKKGKVAILCAANVGTRVVTGPRGICTCGLAMRL